jgi:hypothetical protein
MAAKGGQDKMAVVNVDWFFTEENLEKLSDEELLCILRDLQEIQKEKRGGRLVTAVLSRLNQSTTRSVAGQISTSSIAATKCRGFSPLSSVTSDGLAASMPLSAHPLRDSDIGCGGF